jgi:hypothetical protein
LERAQQEPAHRGTRLALGPLLARSWDVYKRIFFKSAIAFGVVFLVLMPLPPVVALSAPPFLLIPISILLQLVIPAVAGTIAVMVVTVLAAEKLKDGSATIGDGLRIIVANKGAVLGAMALSALLTMAVAFLISLYASLVFHLFLGPPLIAQAVTLEGQSLGNAVKYVQNLTRGRFGRVLLYLLNVALLVGIVALVLVGGLTTSVLGAPFAVRTAVFILSQSLLLGALTAFMVVFETVLFFELRNSVTATSSPG